MRKYLLFAVIAGLVAFMAPMAVADTPDDETLARTPVAVQRVNVSPLGLSDEAAMVLVGSALMTFGPALASRMLDGPVERADTKNLQAEILSTLQQILAKLDR